MTSIQNTQNKGSIYAENIGGIEKTTVEFSDGTTVLVGRNATNRTSFLQAAMAALGSENVTVKGDAEEASVELTLHDETYTRQLYDREKTVTGDGDPYLDDPTLADLFAFLLESNEARRAVRANEDLRELIMRPVDTDQIESTIDRLVQKRQTLEDELSEIQDIKGTLPELEERRQRLMQDIESKKADLESKTEEIQNAGGDADQKRDEKSEFDAKLEELNETREELDDLRYELETERESLTALQQEHGELQTKLEDLPETPVDDGDNLESEIERLREQKQSLQTDANKLQNVIGFNEEMLEKKDVLSSAIGGEESGDVTDQLLPEDTLQCWTCGNRVEKTEIESTLDQLRKFSRTKMSELRELDDEISDLVDQQRERKERRQKRERFEQNLSVLETEIDQTKEKIEQLQTRRESVTGEVEQLESAVDELESKDNDRILTLHKEANQLQYELGNLENELQRVEQNIEQIEEEIDRESDIEAQVESVSEEITEHRTKIERLEKNAVEEFSEHMDTVLDLLDYDNLDRIWIERVERDVRNGRKTVSEHAFELHVVRTSDSGKVYEDTVDHLSESEREVTGLVFALAGYLAHEVYDEVPIMILDSLEAIDSERSAKLINYLTEFTDYLFVALLPEDASALPDEYERVTEI
jgi:chromosome segregation ATPase